MDAGLINLCIASAGPKVGSATAAVFTPDYNHPQVWWAPPPDPLRWRLWVVISVSPKTPLGLACVQGTGQNSPAAALDSPFRILLDSWPRCFSGLEIEGCCCIAGLTGLPFMERKSSWCLERWQDWNAKEMIAGHVMWRAPAFPEVLLPPSILYMETRRQHEDSFFCRLYQFFCPSNILGFMDTHECHRCGSACNKLWDHQWMKQNSAMYFIYLKITWVTLKSSLTWCA